MNGIIVERSVGVSGNAIVTHAIGSTYYATWSKVARSSWLLYCEKHDLGLFVIDTVIESDGKTLYWQKMLIGKFLLELNIGILNVCYLDTDILISPGAPNIFKSYCEERIGLVSQFKSIPYDRIKVLKRASFFRHNYYSSEYPLNSSIFYEAEDAYKFHKLKEYDDYACTGLFLFNLEQHSSFLYDVYQKYKKDHLSLDGGGEEVYLNFEVLNNQLVQWLPYAWQALWIYEMPWCHSSLYYNYSKEALFDAVKTSLFNCHFLHFAGSWEGFMFEDCEGLFDQLNMDEYHEFFTYEFSKVVKKPVGRIVRGIGSSK